MSNVNAYNTSRVLHNDKDQTANNSHVTVPKLVNAKEDLVIGPICTKNFHLESQAKFPEIFSFKKTEGVLYCGIEF